MAWNNLRVYFDQIETWEALSDSERGRLLLAALQYAASEKLPEFGGNERYCWPQIKAQIDRERAAYLEKVQQCSQAGKASAETRKFQRPLTTVNENQRPFYKEPYKEPEPEEEPEDNTLVEEKKAKEKKATAFEAFAWENTSDPDSEEALLKALRDFESMRKKIKKPLTDSTIERLLAKLRKDFQREDWIPVLNQSTDHCWQDIYQLKVQEDLKPAKGKKQFTTQEEYAAKPNAINTSQLDKIQAIFGGA